MNWHVRKIIPVVMILMLAVGGATARAGVTATISGLLRHPSGAVVPDAQVIARNRQTGTVMNTVTDAQGFYSLQGLPVDTYDVEINKAGFKRFVQSGVVLSVNDVLKVDAVLQLGSAEEKVTVSADALHVETTSSQMGEVISGDTMTAVPLVSRSYTDLLALQPGVAPSSSGLAGGQGGNFSATGFAITPISGSLNAGNQSVNGQRESSNGFLLNGTTVQEFAFSGTGIIPNLDSIEEFRILTNNFNAEYGNYSGGQINVVTKSGTNSFHGDVFEFLRNTDLDARNYYSPTRGVYIQNQFGGTVGGPIRKNKIFWFVDYQGTRQILGATQSYPVPSDSNRTGDLSDSASSLTGTVQGVGWANTLSQTLGYQVAQGENYYTPGCTSNANCVFPNALIPQRAWSPVATNTLKYVPAQNGVVT